jgi:hypothetical protein
MGETVTGRNSYTATELAEFCLPGFPTSRKNWYRRLRKDAWSFIERRGNGPGGVVREFIPPPDVQALIDAKRQGREGAPEALDAPQAAEEGTGEAGLLRSPSRAEYAVNRAFRWGCVDAELLARVAIACSVVHGRPFDQVGLSHQVQAAAEAYNALLSFASHLPAGPEALRQLDQEALVAQLRLLVQLGALKPWTPA